TQFRGLGRVSHSPLPAGCRQQTCDDRLAPPGWRRHAEAVQPTPSPPPAAKPVGWPPHFLLPVLVAAAILLVGEDRWVVPLLPAGSRSGLARHRAPAPRSFGTRPHAIPSTPHNAQRETTLNGN